MVVVVVGSVVVVVAGVAVVVVVTRVVSAVEVGLEAGVREGVLGGTVVVAGVIDVLEGGGSARLGVSSDPARHAPRSKGTTTNEAASFLAICPERRAVRELSYRSCSGVPPVILDGWSWPPYG